MIMKWSRSKKDMEVKEAFLINGSKLLKKSVAFCNGRCNPIRNFSAEELKKATKNYDENNVLKLDGYYELYRNFLQDRPVIVKKFLEVGVEQFAINEIVYASAMSVHINSLKLLGCCLETPTPILVFESAEEKTLADRIIDREDADCELDENYIVKLSDFSLCVSIPEGKSHVKDIVAGTVGLIAPESWATAYFNEKSDVYSFGVVLLVILTGQRSFDLGRSEKGEQFLLVDHLKQYIETGSFKEMVDPVILAEEAGHDIEEQLESFRALAISCINDSPEARPTIIQVAKELGRIHLSSCAT